jgi:non-heme chloroperoxidase
MNTLTTEDNTELFFHDWGTGQPVVFSHAYTLTADSFEDQMFFLTSHGYRCIAHDRRGHGRSGQPWQGNDMDTYADDLAQLLEKLDLKNVVLVGHSTGGGEVARYIGRHGTSRVAKVVLIGAVPPWMVKTPANPEGIPREVFDGFRQAVLSDRSQFYKNLAVPYFGANRPGASVSAGLIAGSWLEGMSGSLPASLLCLAALSETNMTEDLKRIDVPTLVLHGDDDQIVPLGVSSMKSSKIIPNATLKIYPGAPHAMITTLKNQISEDLLVFIGTGSLPTTGN